MTQISLQPVRFWSVLASAHLSGSSPRQEEVRPQDTVSVIGGVAGSSKHGRKAAWKFVKDNWEELYNRYQGGFLISRLIKVETKTPAAASASHTETHEDVSSHIHSVWWIRKKLIQVLGDELQCLFAFVCSCSLLFAAHSWWICYRQNGCWSEGESSTELLSTLQFNLLFFSERFKNIWPIQKCYIVEAEVVFCTFSFTFYWSEWGAETDMIMWQVETLRSSAGVKPDPVM